MIELTHICRCDRCGIVNDVFSTPSQKVSDLTMRNMWFMVPTAWEWFDRKLYCVACLETVRAHLQSVPTEYKIAMEPTPNV